MNEVIGEWSERIRAAADSGAALDLCGGGSKRFLGQGSEGDVLDTRSYAGVVAYEPTELVVTVRAGTPLAELQATLADKGQMLAFEPPAFGDGATVGGCVAAGLSGPRRMAVGPLRDFVLGVKVVDGRGELLNFGGQVMKNVAGYDLSRLLTGSMGTLAVIAEVSLKVVPRPVAETTLRFELDQEQALIRLNQWGGQALPVSGSFWHDGTLALRLSGAQAAVTAACTRLGGEALEAGAADALWLSVREQTHDFFNECPALWRLALPTDAKVVSLAGAQAIEWGGGQRWLATDAGADAVRAVAVAAGGHATLFRGGDKSVGVFQPLAPAVKTISRRIKNALDPNNVFGRGRIYADL